MRKWYADKDAAKKAWEQMTPEQRKQAEISWSLAKQHEARSMSSAGRQEVPAVGASWPPVPLAGSPVRVAGPEGSLSTQVLVSQVAASVVSSDSLAAGPLPLAHPEA